MTATAGRLVLAAALCLASGCGSGADATAESRVDRCVERFLARVEASEDGVREYIERTYCIRFERRGWVYDDGTLAIDAHSRFVEGGMEACEAAEVGGDTRTVPCEKLEAEEAAATLECAILHHVRRAEVREYVDTLLQRGVVRCDDGTPLDELGVP